MCTFLDINSRRMLVCIQGAMYIHYLCQIFQELCLFQVLRLFRSLELLFYLVFNLMKINLKSGHVSNIVTKQQEILVMIQKHRKILNHNLDANFEVMLESMN